MAGDERCLIGILWSTTAFLGLPLPLFYITDYKIPSAA